MTEAGQLGGGTCGVPDAVCCRTTWEDRTELRRAAGVAPVTGCGSTSQETSGSQESCLSTRAPAPATRAPHVLQSPGLEPQRVSRFPMFMAQRRGFITPTVPFFGALEQQWSGFTGHFDHSPSLLYVACSSWGPPGRSREHRKRYEGPSSWFSKHGSAPVPGWPGRGACPLPEALGVEARRAQRGQQPGVEATVRNSSQGQRSRSPKTAPQACQIIKCFYFSYVTLRFASKFTEGLVFLYSIISCNS